MHPFRLAAFGLISTVALFGTGAASSLAGDVEDVSVAGSVFERIEQIDARIFITDPKCMRECSRNQKGTTQEECRAQCQMGREEKAPPTEIIDADCIRHCEEKQGKSPGECRRICTF